ncbi:MAG: hypothetical protein VKL41_12220 [Snowella sp.]|jgi:hypothetical protein|nr:hypothetical protein [Snowella sp.]
MAWQTYGLDQYAQKLVLKAKKKDADSLKAKKKDADSLNQSYKMRMAVAYGLERFWGEHLRLQSREPNKAKYWKKTWDSLVEIMAKAGVEIPNDNVRVDRTEEIEAMSAKLWSIPLEDQRVAVAVLTQLCDCLVWWTQRYKGKTDTHFEEDE